MKHWLFVISLLIIIKINLKASFWLLNFQLSYALNSLLDFQLDELHPKLDNSLTKTNVTYQYESANMSNISVLNSAFNYMKQFNAVEFLTFLAMVKTALWWLVQTLQSGLLTWDTKLRPPLARSGIPTTFEKIWNTYNLWQINDHFPVSDC